SGRSSKTPQVISENWETYHNCVDVGNLTDSKLLIRRTLGVEGRFCDNRSTDRPQVIESKSGEMSEWLKEHAWKATPRARADAHQIPPTHLSFNDFRNIDMRRRFPVNRGVDRGFRGYVTQF